MDQVNPSLPVVLAVDPGRAKCGIAVVDADGRTLHRAIVSTEALPAVVADLAARFAPRAVLMGGATGATALLKALAALALPVPLLRVDERRTSEMARSRYLEAHPPRGWRRLLPRGMRTPDAPYDDYVAVLLAERWWNEQKG